MNSSSVSGSPSDIYCSEQSSFNWVNKKVCGMLLCYAVRLGYCVFCFCQSLTNLLRSTTQGGNTAHTFPASAPVSKINTEIQMTSRPLFPAPQGWNRVARLVRRYQRKLLSALLDYWTEMIVHIRLGVECYLRHLERQYYFPLYPSSPVTTQTSEEQSDYQKVLQHSQGYMRHLGTS